MSATAETSAIPATVTAPVRSYLRDRHFDATLILAPLLLGFTAAAIAAGDRRLYSLLLLADVWLLGYHHVVATYTRLAFSPEGFKQNRFLAVDLLLVVTVVAVGTAVLAGTWVIASAFLYLQWFHYMRQGYGISRMYYRTTPGGRVAGARDWAADLVIYLVPIYGIAQRSATMGDQFLSLPVKTIVLPQVVVTGLGVAAAMAATAWVIGLGKAAVQGRLDGRYTAFVGSHVAMFLLAYVVTADANLGWLAINIWHNFQYVLVVWMVNGKRYAGGVDATQSLISRISQPGRAAAYFGTCLGISTVIYFSLNQVTSFVFGGGVAAILGVYMGINFHHYVVDAMIWKRRRVATQSA